MKTRTAFKLIGPEGVVECWVGNLRDFALDLDEFILPILEGSIIAKFNEQKILICPSDTAQTIYENFKEVLY